MPLMCIPLSDAVRVCYTVGLALAAFVAACGAVAAQQAANMPCTVAAPCTTALGSYVAAAPAGWDGRSRLDVAVYVHGYQSSAADIVADKSLVAAFHERGALLVAPDGRGGRWGVPGTPGFSHTNGRDDVAFIASVLADVEKRYPVRLDRAALFGFSLGGSFVWTVACERPRLFHRYVAIAGGFCRPHPQRCAQGPVDLLHIHGLADGTVPLAGRLIRKTHRQGDIPQGLAFWRASKSCGRLSALRAEAGLTCERAADCAGGTSITSCFHPGGHWVDAQWIAWSLETLWPRPAPDRR